MLLPPDKNDSIGILGWNFRIQEKAIAPQVDSLNKLADSYYKKFEFNEKTLHRPNGDTAHLYYWVDSAKHIRFISERKEDSLKNAYVWMAFFRGDSIFKLEISHNLSSKYGATFTRALAYYLKDTAIIIGRSDFVELAKEKKRLLQDSLVKEINTTK